MPLVTNDELYAWLDILAEDDPHAVVPAIRNSIEEILADVTSQTFGPSEEIEDEMQDGHGTDTLYTRRPIASVESVRFRYGVDALQDYEVDVIEGISFQVGKRRLVLRSQVGAPYLLFPRGKNNILINYTTTANEPHIAKQAVREVTAAVWRRIGSEDARSEQIGTFQHVLLRNIRESFTWQTALDVLSIPALG